jgi:Phosphotransferase enzyme family
MAAEPRPDHYERLVWLQPDWLARVRTWIEAQLERSGSSLTGEIEQPHVRWWSTVLRVPTSQGDLYFKAAAPVHAFEPALVAALARVRPGRVPDLVASAPESGWMLMRDGGARLRELIYSAADLDHWEKVLPLYADLQVALAPDAEVLLGLGVPDERLAGLPARFERLLEDPEMLRVDLPDGLTSPEYEQLRELTPAVAAMCRELAAYDIPEILQHDDLHDGNVFVHDGDYVFFDWGDSCVSHPFHTLVVTLRSIAYRFELEPGGAVLERLRDAYLEPFTRYARRSELVAAVDLAYRVGTLARTLAWSRFVAAMDRPFWDECVDAVAYGLKRFLADGPLGSWA